jgi:hypothetical protein
MRNPIRIARRLLKSRAIAASTTPIGDALAIEMGMLDNVVMLDRQRQPLHHMTYEQIGQSAWAVYCESCDHDDIVYSEDAVVGLVAAHSLEQVKRG